MPYYRVGTTMMHVHMSARQRKKAPPACRFFVTVKGERVRCMAITTHLCDWLGCNVPMCSQHAQELVPGFDFCPTHNSRRGLFSRLLPAPATQKDQRG